MYVNLNKLLYIFISFYDLCVLYVNDISLVRKEQGLEKAGDSRLSGAHKTGEWGPSGHHKHLPSGQDTGNVGHSLPRLCLVNLT